MEWIKTLMLIVASILSGILSVFVKGDASTTLQAFSIAGLIIIISLLTITVRLTINTNEIIKKLKP